MNAARHLFGVVLAVSLTGGLAGMALAAEASPRGSPQAASAKEPTHLAGYDRIRTLGGPSSVSGQLSADHLVKRTGRLDFLTRSLRPYYDFKSCLQKRVGLSFGLDYNVFYQVATARLAGGPDEAAGGVFRFYGQWALLCQATDNQGAFVWKVENRSPLGTDLSPNGLGPAVGSLYPSATTFSDWGWGVTNLEWQQNLRFGGVRGGFALGQVDVTDWLGVLELTNPWTGFVSIIPLVYPTDPVPDQGLGAMAFAFFGERNAPYVLAGVSDANGQPYEVGFDSFFDVAEYYTYGQIGWTPSYARRFDDTVYLSFWHQDARTAAGVPEGRGVSGTAAWSFCNDRLHPFVHAGYSSGGAAPAKWAASLGTGYTLRNHDVVGLAAAWSRPFDDTLQDQFSFELFYNLGLGKQVHLTPDVQVVVNPSDNPGEDVIGLFGIRLRVDF